MSLLAPLAQAPQPPSVPAPVVDQVRVLSREADQLAARAHELARSIGLEAEPDATRLGILHGYLWVFVISLAVTLLTTPIMRRLAVRNGIIDRPNEARKIHRMPIAYLGGVAVYLGIMAGIVFSYFAVFQEGLISFHASTKLVDGEFHDPVPISIVLGITVIMLVGLFDDVMGISPRVKVGGQLAAAAALAAQDVGVKVAQGVLAPLGELLGNSDLIWTIPLGADLPLLGTHVVFDLVYWAGTIIIAVFVLGGCNASNLIDGLDGLLSGVTAIAMIGLLFIALSLALVDDGPRDAQRIVLCLAVLGACLGFLPHNFNPATIFLGDCGALMLGFCTVVVILTLGDTGKTRLVIAGLIVYSIPIIDTTLAIVRRRLAGKPLSAPDDQHLHHMLKRALGVKGAVLTLYALGIGFAGLGIGISLGGARVTYALALLFAAYIIVTAVKIARRRHIEEQAAAYDARRAPAGFVSGAPGRQPHEPDSAGTPVPAQAPPASGG